jgi:hypothetical protein
VTYFNDRRDTNPPIYLANPEREAKERQARANAGAPLVKGVKGRDQALGNMAPKAREIAELKTKARANRPDRKGKPGGNLVNKYSGVVSGSTGKAKRFGGGMGGGGFNVNDLNR